MVDLSHLVLKIRPTHSDTIPANSGRSTQAWFLASLQQINPMLSKAIHDGSNLKPFTTSGIFPTSKSELLELSKYRTYSIQVTTLDKDLTRIVQNALVADWLQDGITIHDQSFLVEDIESEVVSYADLIARYVEVHNRRQYVSFEFCSPTYFKKTGGLIYPLPMPDMLFNSLNNKWRMFSDVELPDDLSDFISTRIEITKHQVRTQFVSHARANRGAATGFVGTTTFRAQSNITHIRTWLTLCEYARFAGVGAGTTFGFGRVQVEI